MNIAIIGSGNIGGGLARAWRKAGHTVTFGARDPNDSDLTTLCKEIGAHAATISAAVAPAEIVALAMPAKAVDDVAKAADFAGKIVIDCTNNVPRGVQPTSWAEEIATKLPGARVFKSFNAQGAENLANPVYNGVKSSNFFCGDDPAAKKIVHQLVEDVGFEAVDAGGLAQAKLLEALMLLWVASSRSLATRDLAFKLLRR